MTGSFPGTAGSFRPRPKRHWPFPHSAISSVPSIDVSRSPLPQFSGLGRAVAVGRRPSLCAASHAGNRLRAASEPASRIERRVCRIPQIRSRRRSPAARLAGLRTFRPVLRQGIRGRHEPPLLPGPRHQRLDGFRLGRRHENRVRPPDRRRARAISPCSREMRSACRAWPTVWCGMSRRRRNPAHLISLFDLLEEAQAAGGNATRPGPARAGGNDPAAGAHDRHLSDVFVEPELLRGCFQHLRFRRHDVAIFHLLDSQEIDFNFRRPMRFLDMEGGAAIFADPNEIADRYHRALTALSGRAQAARAGVVGRLSPGASQRGL